MKIGTCLLAAGLVLTALCAWGQTPPSPGAILEQQREQRRLLREQLDPDARQSLPARSVEEASPPAADAAPPASGASFLLQRVVLNPSAVFSEEELRAIAGRYTGHRVTIADLFALVADFNRAYQARQVVGAKAVLPPQKITQGTVSIRLIEGRVGKVQVTELRDTLPEYVSERLTLEPGELVYMDDLESQLFHFNTLNDIRIRAVLKPGERFGTTDYEIRAEEPQRHNYNLFADNGGTRDVGEYRIGFNYSDRSLSGRRDLLSLGAHMGEGSRGLYISYNFPLGVKGTRLGFSADYSQIEIIDGALAPLDVTGSSWNLGAFVTHPLHVGRDYLMNGFIGINAKSSSTEFDGVELFDSDVRTLSLGVDASAYRAGSSWYTRHYLTYGPNGLDNDVNFVKYNGEGSWMRVLDNRWVLTLRGKLQLADRQLLPSSEQFQIGGMATVRGYPEGLLIGDKGYMISTELSIPWPGDPKSANPLESRARALLFLDHGAAFPFKGNNEGKHRDDYLTSAGVGVQFNLGPKLRGRLLFSQPLFTREDNEDDLRVHFYLESTPI
ncbi:MAG: ShlB/FhaC/HecB family hemolysin secretion/activation protein [Gammaproteobacteria bacterium]|nr:ShlB/FhaC/HecB family hemolysin secretion/activation protein [Gammaproteobacteria bacterium]